MDRGRAGAAEKTAAVRFFFRSPFFYTIHHIFNTFARYNKPCKIKKGKLLQLRIKKRGK